MTAQEERIVRRFADDLMFWTSSALDTYAKGEKEEAVKELQHVKYEADTLIALIEGKGDE